MSELMRWLSKVKSVRGSQRCAARYKIAMNGGIRVEQLRTLCKKLRIYDSSHFMGYMVGFPRCMENGKVLAWYGHPKEDA